MGNRVRNYSSVSNVGALRQPMTYDGHPNPSLIALQSQERHKMTLEELRQPSMNSDDLITKTGQ